MSDKPLTIVIPVRDESETISDTIRHLQQSVKTPHVIYIADDHIHRFDRTHDEVLKLQNTYKNIVWISKNSGDKDGFGPALCRAIRKISTPYTVIVMSDSCDDATAVDRMYKNILLYKRDIVCGSRYGKNGKKVGGRPLQNFLSGLLNTGLFLCGFPTRDATNAFKMYKTQFLQRILPTYPSVGVEFSFELSLLAKKHHATWKDFSTTWTGRTKGASKVLLLTRGPKYLKLLVQSI